MEYGNAYRILRPIKIKIMINCNSHKDKSVLNDRRIFIPIKFWLFLSEIKIFLITFKLLMKLFSHKIYYTQDDDSLFWQSPMNQTVPRILFILKAFPLTKMEPPGWLSRCFYSHLRIINDILISAPSNNLSATNWFVLN